MPGWNFLDPNQEQSFLQQVRDSGGNISDAIAFVNNKKKEQYASQQFGLDVQKQNIETKKVERDLKDLSQQPEGKNQFADMNDFQRKLVNARVAGGEVLKKLQAGSVSTGPISTSIQKIGELVGNTTGTAYRAELAAAGAQLFNALAGTTQSPQEIKKLQKLIPSEYDQETVATEKLATLLSLLDRQMQIQGVDTSVFQSNQITPGLDIGSKEQVDAPMGAEPAISMTGAIADYGDLIQNEDGSLQIYGDPSEAKDFFKKTDDGGIVENSFIKTLADSEILPIAGSVAGAFLGAGVWSIATGAAGASIGKMMQQGLRELIDPERQTLTDGARAVLIEGATDALLGGTMFAIGKGVKTGLKLVIGDGAKEVAEQGAKTYGKRTRDLVARGLEIKPVTEQKAYARKTGGRDLVADIMEKFGIPKTGKALAKGASSLKKSSAKKLTSLLAGKTAKTADVIKEISDLEVGRVLTPNAELKTGLEAGTNQVDSFIKEIASYGDEIPLENLNEIKSRMQDVFTTTGEFHGVSKSSKQLLADTSRVVRKFINQFHPEIEGTNKDKILSYMAKQIGERIDSKKAKALFNFTDLVVGVGGGLPLLLTKKGIDLFSRTFDDPLIQSRIIQKGLELSVAMQNRNGVRNVLRFADKLGLQYIGTGIRGAAAGVGSSMITGSSEQPGLDIQQNTNQQGIDLGAFSPEGVPLYR